MLDRLSARVALGVLRVTEPKSTATGASVATGTIGVGAVPVPLRPTVCGLPAAVDVIVTAPVDATAPVGAKVTLIVQLAAAASVAAQLCAERESASGGHDRADAERGAARVRQRDRLGGTRVPTV